MIESALDRLYDTIKPVEDEGRKREFLPRPFERRFFFGKRTGVNELVAGLSFNKTPEVFWLKQEPTERPPYYSESLVLIGAEELKANLGSLKKSYSTIKSSQQNIEFAMKNDALALASMSCLMVPPETGINWLYFEDCESVALFRHILESSKPRYVNCLKALLIKYPFLAMTKINDNPILYYAIIGSNTVAVEVLLKMGVNPNEFFLNSYSPLELAISVGNNEIVQLLIRAGANIETRLSYLESALFKAIRIGSLDITRTLLAAKASVNILNIKKATPLHLAASEGYLDILCELIAADAEINPLDEFNNTPLMLATMGNHYPVVRELLSKGANKELSGTDLTPLIYSVHFNYDQIAHVLIECGANVNAKTNTGATALYQAIVQCNYGLIAKLIQFGADETIVDIYQQSAFIAVEEMGFDDVKEVFYRALVVRELKRFFAERT